MYESFYNLKVEPFRLSPDHRFCFSHKSYAKAKAYMQYAIHRAEGFVMVTGKPGTGKTTLVNDLVDGLSHSQIVVATIVSTQLEADDLLRLVAYNFGLEVDAPNKAVLLQGLSVRLRRYHEEGTRALLIIDEAQDLSTSALEELRLLTNLQLNNQPLLQIFLVGQENLRDLVQKPTMEQVHQRLVAACHLEALNEADTEAYIKHRLDRVGWKNDPKIDQGVYPLVYQFSKGVPRRINLVCSRFLLHGCVEEKHRIRASDVRTVVEELQHEQLAPVGFKADLPPLPVEDEIDEPELEMDSDADDQQPENAAAEQSSEDAGKDDVSVEEKPAVIPKPEPAPVKRMDGVADLSSREDRIRERESGSSAAPDDTEEDVIQENYFSLSDAVDPPSQPVLIKKPLDTRPTPRGGYGDRFATVKLNEAAGVGRTHYYNQYQAGAHPAGEGSGKWRKLSKTLLFLLVVFTIAAAIYLLSPQLLDGSFSKLDQETGQLTAELNQAQVAAEASVSPAEGGTGEAVTGIQDNTPVVPETKSEAGIASVESGSLVGDHPVDSDPVSQAVQDGQALLAQKKTAPEVELSHVSPLPEAPSADRLTRVALAADQLAGTDRLTSGGLMARGEKVADKIALTSQAYPVNTHNRQTVAAVAKPVPLPAPNVSGAAEVPTTTPLVDTDAPAMKVAAISGLSSDTRHAAPAANQPIEPVLRKKIFFRSDSTFIKDEYKAQLSQVAEWLQAHDGSSVHIIGYADNRGDPAYNQALSLKRAKAVAAYLESKNVHDSRFRIEGRGVYSGTDSPSTGATRERQMQRLVVIVAAPLAD